MVVSRTVCSLLVFHARSGRTVEGLKTRAICMRYVHNIVDLHIIYMYIEIFTVHLKEVETSNV